MKEIIMKVEGIECGGCENRIQNTLKNIKGVENVVANHANGTVTVILNSQVTEDVLTKEIENIGFKVVKEG